MIKIGDIYTFGWEAAIRGMRNSYASWDKSDSGFCGKDFKGEDIYVIGPNDLKLASNLCIKGGPHAKFRRMIHVQMDILAPFYWWKEYDTYKVGTVTNSTSTMHSIMSKEFSIDDFSHGDSGILSPIMGMQLISTVTALNALREKYLEEKNPKLKEMYWTDTIQLLPCGYNQLRTIDINYEVLAQIVEYRSNHKLPEWKQFCEQIKERCPYANELIIGKGIPEE